MISDTLVQAIEDINDYIKDYPDVYEGALLTKVVWVRTQMEELAAILDNPEKDC